MAETRMLPKKTPRSTGIERTSITNNRPNPIGTNATSHVSAAPGVNSQTHAHVVSARDPAGAARRQISQQQAGQPRRAQDAKVEIVDRRQLGNGSIRPTVQVIDRPRASLGGPFEADEMMLIGSLLEQYADRAVKGGDQEQSSIAFRALASLRDLLRSAPALPIAPIAPIANEDPMRTTRGAAPIARDALEISGQLPGVGGAIPIAAQTSTVLVDIAAMRAREAARAGDPALPPFGSAAGDDPGAA